MPKRIQPPLGFLLGHKLDLNFGRVSALAHDVTRRDGVLLLLSALALGVLIVASVALMRLLRLNQDWWEGRTP